MNRKVIWILLPVLVLTICVALYTTGNLPFLPDGNGSALDDTSAAGLDGSDEGENGEGFGVEDGGSQGDGVGAQSKE